MQTNITEEETTPLNPENLAKPIPKYSRPPSQATASSIPEEDFKPLTSVSRKGFIIKVCKNFPKNLARKGQPTYLPYPDLTKNLGVWNSDNPIANDVNIC